MSKVEKNLTPEAQNYIMADIESDVYNSFMEYSVMYAEIDIFLSKSKASVNTGKSWITIVRAPMQQPLRNSQIHQHANAFICFPKKRKRSCS